MEARRVVRTEQVMRWPGGLHPHVSALILEDGRRVAADVAIWRLDVRSVAFEVVVDDRVASVSVERCPRCDQDHLCTTLDGPGRQYLLPLSNEPG
jgi:hypothetical protein